MMVDGIKLYSCYCSPNKTHNEYMDFLARLELSISSTHSEVLLTGDFNAHHTDWGSRVCNKRGEALSDLINARGLTICNTGQKPTFQNKNGCSIIDLTIASPMLAAQITNWEVLDTISLSDHNYIMFKIGALIPNTPQNTHTWNSRNVNEKKLAAALAARKLDMDVSGLHADECARNLTTKIQETCRCITPALLSGSRRKSVYWWSLEISELRKKANHLRRVHQRKMRRTGPAECENKREEAKEAKLTLVKAIKKAKDAKWKDLCDQVELDPWGMPYKLVMDRPTRPPPIPGLDTPGRMDMIVHELFPQHPKRSPERWPLSCSRDAVEAAIGIDELVRAASSLRKNTAPGPDGITNDVLQLFARCQPEIFLEAYNRCLTEGCFPTIWKTARLVLLRKGDKPLDVASSYRPLCILNYPGKLLEKILDNRLRKFLEDTENLSQTQFGFRKSRSTTNAVNARRHIVETSRPKKKTGVLTLDIKNAFNSAPWEAILDTMQDMNIPMYMCRIIGSYLDNRRIQIHTRGKIKEEVLSSGVPQGSVLGPTLWNILYDGLLRKHLPAGVSFLAFAEDVALKAWRRTQ